MADLSRLHDNLTCSTVTTYPLPFRQPPVSSTSTSNNQPRITPLLALTTYQAHMMLMTVLSILVVDFPVFPRIRVKCETIGVAWVWTLDYDIRFITLLLKNLDRTWCRIFCVLARRCICYTTYQRLRLSNFSNRVQGITCNSRIAPNHCPRSYLRYSCRRSRLFGNLFR